MADLLRFEVIGDLPIRDAETKQSVPKGGVVRLDPDKTIISALQEAGCIGQPLADEPEPAAIEADSKSGDKTRTV